MNQKEAIDRILLEVRTNKNPPISQDFIPSIEVVPLIHLPYYFNMLYAMGYLEGKKSGHGHKKPVLQSSPANRPLKIWPSQIEAAKHIGVSHSDLWKAIKRGKLYKGYFWTLKE